MWLVFRGYASSVFLFYASIAWDALLWDTSLWDGNRRCLWDIVRDSWTWDIYSPHKVRSLLDYSKAEIHRDRGGELGRTRQLSDWSVGSVCCPLFALLLYALNSYFSIFLSYIFILTNLQFNNSFLMILIHKFHKKYLTQNTNKANKTSKKSPKYLYP